jgi:DNA-binding transcriptional MerR regulator
MLGILVSVVVLLIMQKKAEQLDLFGFPVPSPTPVPKKSRPAPAQPASPIERVDAKRALAKPPASHEIEEPVAPPKRLRNPTPVSGSKRGRKSFREMDSEVDLIEVPSEEKLNEKLYYSISEVASWFKVNTSLLRFWENEFDILQPRKTRKGDRLFRVEDIKNLQLIYFLLRQRKFSIDGAKNFLQANKKDIDKQFQLVQSLNRFKTFLLELQSQL